MSCHAVYQAFYILEAKCSTASGQRCFLFHFPQGFSLFSVFWKPVWLLLYLRGEPVLSSFCINYLHFTNQKVSRHSTFLVWDQITFTVSFLVDFLFSFFLLWYSFSPFYKVNCVSHSAVIGFLIFPSSIGSIPSTLNINSHVIILLNVTFIRKVTCI